MIYDIKKKSFFLVLLSLKIKNGKTVLAYQVKEMKEDEEGNGIVHHSLMG